ncbi:tetratricopeptide repeat protein (plasmid) [Streptomyces sp. NBC_00015]|uniref:tetratricopeptide repeat protein n=1 Tax=Streptomyces sp. NBC_00015 TaxID=2903611 RepID=UPI002F90E584
MTFMHGSEQWSDGLELLHVYALVDLERNPQLARLIAAQRAALTDFPLSFVEDQWLHITLAQIVGHSADSLSTAQREELVSGLTRRLRDMEPVTVMVGSCLSYRTGTLYDLSAAGALVEVGRRVRTVVEAVFGPDAGAFDTGVLHLTHAYATREADSDQVQRKLRHVEPGHAPLAIDAVHLVNVRADNQNKTITWGQPLARIPLGALAQDSAHPHESSGAAGAEVGAADVESIDGLLQAAELAVDEGAFERADELYTSVLAGVETGPCVGDLWHLQILRDHALVAYGLGRWAQGEARLRRVLAGREKLAGRDAAAVIDALARLSEAVGEQHRWVEAEALAQEAVRRADRALPDVHEATLGARLALAWVLASSGEPDAESVLRPLVETLEAVHGLSHPDTLAARHLLVELLCDQQRFEEAAVLAADLLALREDTRGPEHPHTLLLRAQFALLLHRTGRTDEAAFLADQTLTTSVRVQGAQAHHTIKIRNIHHEITVG